MHWECFWGNNQVAICFAYQSYCWDWFREEWEDCTNCPEDATDLCIAQGWQDETLCWNGHVDGWEECDNWKKNWKDWCGIDCKYLSDNKCWNGEVDSWETPQECPQDFGWTIVNENCNSCPCEYADLKNALTKWDVVRAKLWDHKLAVFYRYSNNVSVDSYLDI